MTPRLSERLQKLVPLLGSDKDNEALAAVRMIQKALRAEGLDLHDLAMRLSAVQREEAQRAVDAEAERAEPGRAIITVTEMAAFFGELKGIAATKGYAEGWCSHQFREKFGVWPNDPRVKCAPATPASLETARWVKSRAFAYARSRGG
jgi:hypothetical protein